MAINWSTQVYAPQYDVFGRPVTFTPLVSNPNAAAFEGRGIYGTVSVDVIGEDGTVISDQRTILDVLESDFVAVPMQGDHLFIPANVGMPELGNFEVIDTSTNGGGETTLVIRKLMENSIP